jgi:hypothetical protein
MNCFFGAPARFPAGLLFRQEGILIAGPWRSFDLSMSEMGMLPQPNLRNVVNLLAIIDLPYLHDRGLGIYCGRCSRFQQGVLLT